MPELPEIETICIELKNKITHRKIINIKTSKFRLRQTIPNLDILTGSKVNKVYRRAKYINIEFENNYILVLHLGMSGRILINDKYIPQKHDHLTIEFENNLFLTLNDPRRFGLIDIIKDEPIYYQKQGIEPLEMDEHYLYELSRNKKSSIKQFLMNNKYIVGVGNIYACEALFKSHIHPAKQVFLLSESDFQLLVKNIKETLKEAIEAGGSSLRDYKKTNGDLGYFQAHHFVYNKTGKNCKICGSIIEKIKQGGRSSFYCPTCQVL